MIKTDVPDGWLTGRRKIMTHVREVTQDNLIDVLTAAMKVHQLNAAEIQYLINYERGYQPLQRTKTVRSEIDIKVYDNIANYIKEFNIGYFWSNPIMLVQRGDKDVHNDEPVRDDEGISAFNEMLKNGEDIPYKDQYVGEFVEICGIGHKLVDVRTDFDGTDSYVCDYALDSRYAFCVYCNDVAQRKVLGVTYRTTDNGTGVLYTCFTDYYRFETDGETILDIQPNFLGKIPIVEFIRSFDRTGCFERRISEMDSLNVMVSDFTNDVAQRTQEIWWGNDIDLPEDDNGEPKSPSSGQWLLTHTGQDGQNPMVQPLSSTFSGAATLDAITKQRSWILQKCKVPIQYESSGGGSTGTATDMSSGWSAAELEAMRKQQLTEKAKREELSLIIRAVALVPADVLPMDSVIRAIHVEDVEFHFTRRKNYDLSIKANAFATYVSHGVHGRHALKVIDAFEDTEQVWLDSKETIERYQRSIWQSTLTEENITTSDDTINQIDNSPILDGI